MLIKNVSSACLLAVLALAGQHKRLPLRQHRPHRQRRERDRRLRGLRMRSLWRGFR